MSAGDPGPGDVQREVERGLLRLEACRAERDYVIANLAERDAALAALTVERDRLAAALADARSEVQALRPFAARYVRLRSLVPGFLRPRAASVYRRIADRSRRSASGP